MASDPPLSQGPLPATAPAVRDASTVVVVRPGADGPEILMLQRSAKSPFMPSTLVFPGGRRDEEDGPTDDDDAWIRAAVRECVEEASIELDPGRLRWFDTWMTPSAEPRRRYLARFYLAELTASEDHRARADGHETHDERWATVAAHLAAYDAGEVDLPPPTLSILTRIAALSRQALVEVDPRPPILPKYVHRDDTHTILMPHDPDYLDAPGESSPPPLDRLTALPTRFVRDETTWRPA